MNLLQFHCPIHTVHRRPKPGQNSAPDFGPIPQRFAHNRTCFGVDFLPLTGFDFPDRGGVEQLRPTAIMTEAQSRECGVGTLIQVFCKEN
jgi:hypothetical protein